MTDVTLYKTIAGILLFGVLLIIVSMTGCASHEPTPEYVKTVEMSRDQCSVRSTEYFMNSENKIGMLKEELRECKGKLRKLSDKTGIEP